MPDEIATAVPPGIRRSSRVFARRALEHGSPLLPMGSHVAWACALALTIGALASAQLRAPPPQSVIGWEPCADYKLATYEQIEDYFRKLAAAVPARMKLVEMGRTT